MCIRTIKQFYLIYANKDRASNKNIFLYVGIFGKPSPTIENEIYLRRKKKVVSY